MLSSRGLPGIGRIASAPGRNDARVRPPRDDIAMPMIPSGIAWIGPRPQPSALLAADGPVLVHFFDFAQLNSVRTLPYVEEWHHRYAEAGLTVLGVQAPRFPFGADTEVVDAGLRRLGISFPTAADSGRELWLAYGCEGWPCLFLWGRGGVLRWFHFGEGEYQATEEAIQDELRALDALSTLPQPMTPLRPTDEPGATVIGPTPELFPAEGRPWTRAEDGEGFTVEYEAGGASATVEGEGELALTLDGERLSPVAISGAGLYELAEHPHHGRHVLAIDLSGDVRIWSVSFAPGLPGSESG
jgi:hypothetical protein